MTTPPNPSGFIKKPKSKRGEPARSRKRPGKRKADISRSRFIHEYITWYGASRFLMCAAILLAPVFFDESEPTKSHTAE